MTMIRCERWHATLDDSHCGERWHCRGCPNCPEKTELEWAAMRRKLGFDGIGAVPEQAYPRTRKGANTWKYMGAAK